MDDTSTDLYYASANTFAPPAQTTLMNAARQDATATLLPNGEVLIAGGGVLGTALKSTELYDSATNTFAPSDQTASMNGARVGARATPLPNGKVLIENRFGSASASSTTELYTP